jgi:hypothetical protein
METRNLGDDLSEFGKYIFMYAVFLIVNLIITVFSFFSPLDSVFGTLGDLIIAGIGIIILIAILIKAKPIKDASGSIDFRQFFTNFLIGLVLMVASTIIYAIINAMIWDYYLEWLTNDSYTFTDFAIIFAPEIISDVILCISYIFYYKSFVSLKRFFSFSRDNIPHNTWLTSSDALDKLKLANKLAAIQLIFGTIGYLTDYYVISILPLLLIELGLLLGTIVFEMIGYYKLGINLKNINQNIHGMRMFSGGTNLSAPRDSFNRNFPQSRNSNEYRINEQSFDPKISNETKNSHIIPNERNDGIGKLSGLLSISKMVSIKSLSEFSGLDEKEIIDFFNDRRENLYFIRFENESVFIDHNLNTNDLSDMLIKEFGSWKKERSFQV